MEDPAIYDAENKKAETGQSVGKTQSLSLSAVIMGEHDRLKFLTMRAVSVAIKEKEFAAFREMVDEFWPEIKPQIKDSELAERMEKSITDELFWKTVFGSLDILGQILEAQADDEEDGDDGDEDLEDCEE